MLFRGDYREVYGMSIYYNASLNRNLRESRSILMRNKRRYNMKNLKESIKQIISEKENHLKALKESIKIKKSQNKGNSIMNNEENFINKKSNYGLGTFDKKDKIEIEEENKINIEECKNSSNNIINDNLSLDYKFPLLASIKMEIDNLTKEELLEDNNDENRKLDTIYSSIEEENSSEENEMNME